MTLRRAILVFAAMLWIAYAVLDLAGARTEVKILSGTAASDPEILVGIGYTLAWFAAVLAAPILVLGSLIDALLERARGIVRIPWVGSRRR